MILISTIDEITNCKSSEVTLINTFNKEHSIRVLISEFDDIIKSDNISSLLTNSDGSVTILLKNKLFCEGNISIREFSLSALDVIRLQIYQLRKGM